MFTKNAILGIQTVTFEAVTGISFSCAQYPGESWHGPLERETFRAAGIRASSLWINVISLHTLAATLAFIRPPRHLTFPKVGTLLWVEWGENNHEFYESMLGGTWWKSRYFIMMFIHIWHCCKWLTNIYCQFSTNVWFGNTRTANLNEK